MFYRLGFVALTRQGGSHLNWSATRIATKDAMAMEEGED